MVWEVEFGMFWGKTEASQRPNNMIEKSKQYAFGSEGTTAKVWPFSLSVFQSPSGVTVFAIKLVQEGNQ